MESWHRCKGMRPETCKTGLGEPCRAAPRLLAAAVAGLLYVLAVWVFKRF